MIERLIKEIETDLKNKSYISALTIALTLPDICGKAEYPHDGNGQRYKKWYKKYVCTDKPFGLQMPEDLIYSLRCCVLHEGNPKVKSSSKYYKVKKFALIIQENGVSRTNEASCSVEDNNSSEKSYDYYNVNLNFLCEKICEAARQYYNTNKGKFKFLKYRIICVSDFIAQNRGLSEKNIEITL